MTLHRNRSADAARRTKPPRPAFRFYTPFQYYFPAVLVLRADVLAAISLCNA